jgi:D-alanyl-D-alanine dipeptidase
MSETFCPHCGGLHHPGTGSCLESSLAGGTLPDGIQVLERLGKSALGEMYRAKHLDSQVEVELLIIPPTAAGSEPAAQDTGLTHLRDQLHRSAEIKHPNVASVCATGETDEGALWATFEVLHGKLLSEIVSAGRNLSPKESVDLVLQAASGLQAAHEVGLVHGNLSPANILVTHTADNRPLVKLIGFRSVHPGAGRSVAGSENTKYAAPECLAGQSPDERSDVFSLGAVLRHLLTGVAPSAEENKAIPLPEAARRVLAKALEPAADDRFQTIAAFARALATAISRPPARTRSGASRADRLGGVLAIAVAVAIAILLLWRSTLGDPGDGAMASGEPIVTGEVREPAPAALDSTPRPRDGAATESMLVDVRSVDSSIQIDLRYATANNFTGAPLPGYGASRALLRREAAAALGRVQAKLRSKGLGLRVFDAYRPVRASQAMVDWAERTGKNSLLESGYIARRSRHNLGIAVDLTLVNRATGTEVPMGAAFDNFSATAAEMAGASGEALGYREVLSEAMKSEGFRPHGQAWWHFNYPVEGAVPLDRIIR